MTPLPTPLAAVSIELSWLRWPNDPSSFRAADQLRARLRSGELDADLARTVRTALDRWERADDAACIALERVENHVEEEA